MTKRKINRTLNAAIKELKEAKRFVRRNRFEKAEDEIADTLKDLGRALRQINKKEKKRHKKNKTTKSFS